LIPDGLNIISIVTCNVKGRRVTVKGPKGEITKDYRHMPLELTIKKQNIKKRKGLFVNIRMWFAGKK
jgi:ribosomal protein L6P/L9E